MEHIHGNLKVELENSVESLLRDNKLLKLDELNAGYELFQKKFGPKVLKSLDGETLLNVMFETSNRDGLTYWLEFKNDEEFNSGMYGSISGGSAFKYIMFQRTDNYNWVTGAPTKPQILSVDEAIQLGREIRDLLVEGAELISKLSSDKKIEEYMEVQSKFNELMKFNLLDRGWVHKYYHLIYPDKIDAFHNTKWQNHVLINCNVKPIDGSSRYILSGQLMSMISQFNLPSAHIMHAMVNVFKDPVNYYRIGTTVDDINYWEQMNSHNLIGIGWRKLGDFSTYEEQEPMKFKSKVVENLNEVDPNVKGVITKWSNQIKTFYYDLEIGDIVVAANGEKVLGIGKIAGGYEYRSEFEFAHTRKVEWLFVGEVKLPESKEGLQTTVYQFKNLENQLAIKQLIEKGGDTGMTGQSDVNPAAITSLTGVMAQIDRVLKRKKQVILYGPPGTGKTYHAEKTCLELSARTLFKTSYNQLSDEQKARIIGNDNVLGTVRMCCFHPTYGYEDFIEGIKPKVVNQQTVFEQRDGIFKTICEEALKNKETNYYLIIDEINRGDISRIFGELIMLIEAGKRGKKVVLPLSGTAFTVPENLYIVGTMNTADRSISLLDVALRRRFGFVELLTDYSLLKNVSFEGLPLAGWLKELNKRITDYVGKDARNLQIGHSYFLENNKVLSDKNKFKQVIEEDLIPLIEEYCYGDYSLLARILGDGIIDVKNQIIRSELFESSDISDLITALLSPCPMLREQVIDDAMESDESHELEDFESGDEK